MLPDPDLKDYRHDSEEGRPPKAKPAIDNVVQICKTSRHQWSLKASFVTISACLLLTALPWVYYRHNVGTSYTWQNSLRKLIRVYNAQYSRRYRWPIYGDITQDCLGQDSWHPVGNSQDGWPQKHESKTSLEVRLAQFSRQLPSPGRSLLRSGGHNLRGHIKMRTSTEQRKDFVSVHVKISHRQEKALELTKVCRLTQRDWHSGIITEGVGIFVSTYFTYSASMGLLTMPDTRIRLEIRV